MIEAGDVNPMKLLRIFLPVLAACGLLTGLLAWVHQSAQAHELQPGMFPLIDARQALSQNTPQSTDIFTNILPAGDEYIHGLVYYDGYLYGSTRSTSPTEARVLKIDPATLNVIVTKTLTSLIDAEDIVAANNYLWAVLFMEPAELVRIDPATMDWNVALVFNQTTETTMGAGASLTYAFGSLWVGGREHLAQVDISNPALPTYQLYDFTSLNLPTSSAGLFGSLAHDDQYLWATYKQYTGTQQSGEFYASSVVKINPNDPAGVYTTTEISTDTPDDSVFTGGSYFVAGEGRPNSTTPSDIYKFSSNPTVYTATRAADSASYGLFVDPNEPGYVWGAFVGSPGIVKKFDLNATPLLTVTLPVGFDDPSEVAFDPSGNVYITTWQSPARMVKLTPQYLASDLSISMSDLSDPVYAGNDLTYTLTITNDGPVGTSAVLLTDTLPAQLTFVSSIPGSPGCTSKTGKLICALGDLDAHTSKQVILAAQVNPMASGTITNTAIVTSALSDPNQQNNTASEGTVVVPAAADLSLGVVSSPDPVIAGQFLTYTLTITNNGPSSVASIVVTDTLPVLVDFVSSTPGSPGCTHSGILVTCHLGAMNAFSNRQVTILTRVNGSATGMITNTAKVASSIPDADQQNNTSILQTAVTDSADLKVQISADKTKVAIGDMLVYSITVTNLGPSTAFSITMQDILPQGVDFIASSGSPVTFPCTHPNQEVTCQVGHFGANSKATLQLVVRVNRSAIDTLHNVASVVDITPDPDTTNNTASLDTNVFNRLFLPITR
jgi:uncharacterized repeat protein (TIGR01451 family)